MKVFKIPGTQKMFGLEEVVASPGQPSPNCPPTGGVPPLRPAPAPPSGPTCQQLLTMVVNNFLAGSPMQGLGSVFVADGQAFNVDPRFVVALASAQSSLGRNQGTACNDFGYYFNGYGVCSPFDSYESEIGSVTKNIRIRHRNAGETTAAQVYAGGGMYSCCHGNCSVGLDNLTAALVSMEGDPSNLTFPCNPDGTWKTGP